MEADINVIVDVDPNEVPNVTPSINF